MNKPNYDMLKHTSYEELNKHKEQKNYLRKEIKKLCLELAEINCGIVDLSNMFDINDKVSLDFSEQKNYGHIYTTNQKNKGNVLCGYHKCGGIVITDKETRENEK